jgi:dTDP-4-amino-4,6-dideoxygalactose transaminase
MEPQFEEAIAVGSGTAGIAVALRSLQCPGAWIAVPPTVCPNVVAAVLAADCRPHFVDIERGSLGVDPEELRRDITGVRAVIAVHAYGQPCRIADIVSVCRPAGVLVIEDCAQADGAADECGRPVGTLGDIAVFSYGAGKIIDLGGGGIILANTSKIRDELCKFCQGVASSVAIDAARMALDGMNQTYKQLYNECYPSALSSHRLAFAEMLRAVAAGLTAAEPRRRNEIMAARRSRLGDTIRLRRSKQAVYRARLNGVDGIQFLPTSQNGAPWRFNIWLDASLRNHILRSMLKDDMKISSWHPDIRPFLPEGLYRSGSALPNSAWLGDGVLNLWLDDETSIPEILRTSHEIASRIARRSIRDCDVLRFRPSGEA